MCISDTREREIGITEGRRGEGRVGGREGAEGGGEGWRRSWLRFTSGSYNAKDV